MTHRIQGHVFMRTTRKLSISLFSIIIVSGCSGSSGVLNVRKPDPAASPSINLLESLRVFEQPAAWRDARFIQNIFNSDVKFSRDTKANPSIESYRWQKAEKNQDDAIDGDASIYINENLQYSTMRISLKNRDKICITSSDIKSVYTPSKPPMPVTAIHFRAGPGFIPETDIMNEYYSYGPMKIDITFAYMKCANGIYVTLGDPENFRKYW
ncbi:hypothetical protein [Azospirillum brasilense]|uniref:hypothetical protein n=1 Tax=Azospirillum brasilense TaxID=192 RepID=UPI001B3BDB3E|nr:hypothetical protein [Azospirillum brasilense]